MSTSTCINTVLLWMPLLEVLYHRSDTLLAAGKTNFCVYFFRMRSSKNLRKNFQRELYRCQRNCELAHYIQKIGWKALPKLYTSITNSIKHEFESYLKIYVWFMWNIYCQRVQFRYRSPLCKYDSWSCVRMSELTEREEIPKPKL